MLNIIAFLTPIAIGLVIALVLFEAMHKDNYEPAPTKRKHK